MNTAIACIVHIGDQHRHCYVWYCVTFAGINACYYDTLAHSYRGTVLQKYVKFMVPVSHQQHAGRCGRGLQSGSWTQQAERRNDNPQGQDQSG